MNKDIDKVPCNKCGRLILPATAHDTGGLCMPCFKQGAGLSSAYEAHEKIREQSPEADKRYKVSKVLPATSKNVMGTSQYSED